MWHQHWISEFHREEAPTVISEVREVLNTWTKVSVKYRHKTMVSWNSKLLSSDNDNKNCSSLQFSSDNDGCFSTIYLYIRDHSDCKEERGQSHGICVDEYSHQCEKGKHFVEVKQTVKDYKDWYVVQRNWDLKPNGHCRSSN